MQDVASRLRYRVQLTTDGHKPYLAAVEDSFGADIDNATHTKIYGEDPQPEKAVQPCEVPRLQVGGCDGPARPETHFHVLRGASESHDRMSIRRFTRLTNAFSKKIENHAAAVALYFMYYNFGRVHQTLRVTPAMEAGVSDHVWSIDEIVALLK
jgi:hypothetical protein